MSAVSSIAPDGADGPAAGGEDPIVALRSTVYRRKRDATLRAVQATERLRRQAARAHLLAVLAEEHPVADDWSARLVAAATAVLDSGAEDEATLLDLSIAQLLLEPSRITVDAMDGGIDAVIGGRVAPDGVVYAAERLLAAEQQDAAVALLGVTLDAISAAARSEPAAAPAPGATEVAQPETLSRAPQRLLRRIAKLVDERLGSAPDNGALMVIKAVTLIVAGQPEQGLELVGEALKLDPLPPNAQWVRMTALMALGRYDDALDALCALPPEQQHDSSIVSLRVRMLSYLGRYGEALAIIAQTAAQQADHDGPTARGLATLQVEVLAQAGRIDEALGGLDELGARYPDDGEQLALRADLLWRAGRTDEAIEVLERVIKREPSDVESLRRLGELRLRHGGDPERALAVIEQALAQAPGRPDLLGLRAAGLHSAGHDIEALASVEQALVSAPSDEALAAQRGAILSALGRYEEATSAYVEAVRRGAQRDPGRGSHVEELAQTVSELIGRDQYPAALRAIDDVRELVPPAPSLLGLRAEGLRLAGRLSEAIAQAQEATAAGAESAWMAGTQAEALVTLGRSAQALSLIEPALEQVPDYPFGRITQARALTELGRLDDLRAVIDGPLAAIEPSATMFRAALLINTGRWRESVEELERHERAATDPDHRQDAYLQAIAGCAWHRLGDVARALALLRPAIDPLAPGGDCWGLTELADALAHSDASARSEAMGFYERILAINDGQERLRARLESAWSLFRLGRAPEAIAGYETAFGLATDPLAFDRMRCAILRRLAGESGDGLEPELDAITGSVHPELAHGLLADARHTCAMLGADPAWAAQTRLLLAAHPRFAVPSQEVTSP